jgi:hypothetical protein
MLRVKSASLVIAAVLVISILGGCSGSPGEASAEKYARLEIRMSLAEVEEIMGGPGRIETFEGQPAAETTYRWDAANSGYHIYVTFKDGKVGSLVEYD